ncbi:hypothetical protein BGZ97_006582 [Linnemannia gamsii]|uniref:Uncharacterized protein n=1 Tax=Linnemannia gamsii TaxID=64522 RepID=A0A9P6RFD7_9FUNG|nr:hypothetical protein BGZ97_006582 [Linnemannia gamsii]
MLSTHYLSKRHLARVRRKEQSHNREQEQDLDLDQDQEQAPNTDTEERVTQLEPTSPTQEVLHSSATDNGSSHDVIKEYTAPTSENNSTTQDQPAAGPRKNASQRKRKQERDRKKARARLEKRSKSGHSVMSQSVKGHVETKEEREDEATVSTSNGLLEDAQHHSPMDDAQHHSPMDDDELLRAQCDINAQLAHTSSSSPLVAGSNIAASSTEVHPSTSNAALPQPHQQQHWHCSICGSNWRKEKAWRGHLLSAQHLRHTLATMQQIAPDIRPYGRVDVMASMDPFGWGTGAGVVEEEEEEDSDEDGGDDNDSNVEGKAAVVGNEDDDDMDMSD